MFPDTFIPQFLAHSALSSDSDARVLWGKFVPVVTMRFFLRNTTRSVPEERVLLRGNKLKMFGIDTPAYRTKVV